LVGFPAGVAITQYLPLLPPPWIVAVIGAGALPLVFSRWPVLGWMGLGGVWALGFALFRMADALPVELQKSDVVIEGRIASIPEVGTDDTRFQFDLTRVIEPNAARIPKHIRLTWYRTAPQLRAGDVWRLTVRLKRPHGMANPGGMDYELWLFAHNIRATGYVREAVSNRLMTRAVGCMDIQALRQRVHDHLVHLLGDRPFAGMLEALAMGVEAGIPAAQWDVLRRTGTTHLVAISGSHIALIAGWCFLPARCIACRLLPPSIWPPAVAAIVSLAAAVLYSALAGFAIPTQRALITIAVVTGGILARRHLQLLHTVGVALLAVVVVDPLAVASPGFWLSFLAVALIWLVLANRTGTPRRWVTLWRVNWATAFGLAPILLVFFGQVPLVAPLANLVAVPAIGFMVVPLVLLGTLLIGLNEAVARWLFDQAERVLAWTWAFLEVLASPSSLVWSQPTPPVWTIPLALLGVLLVLAPRGVPGRWLGLMLMLPAVRPPVDSLAPGAFELTVLDVGQGAANVVRTRHRTLVFDTGSRISERLDMGSVVVVPFLRHIGVRRVDMLVISHGDNDHSGGAASLLSLLPVRLVYGSTSSDRSLPNAMACRAGQEWIWDGVRFVFLSPESRGGGTDNDLSCVLQVVGAGKSLLLTGDIEGRTEARLVARFGGQLESSVLVVPHHGSDTSSTRNFLREVRPHYALISSGYLNRFGFPHPRVIARLRETGAMVLNTAREGAISVHFGKDDPPGLPRAYRHSHRRYWMSHESADPGRG
jgi:competence protein ComEC